MAQPFGSLSPGDDNPIVDVPGVGPVLDAAAGARLAAILGQTWPAQLIKGAVGGAMAPGQAFQSTPENPVTTEEMVKPAADLAGALAGWGTSVAQKGTLGMAGGRMPVAPAAETAVAPPFYSAVQRAIEAAPQTRAPGSQWLGTLKNSPGVKPDEIAALGLDKKLGEAPGAAVTKQELLDHVGANQIKLGEVNYGAVPGQPGGSARTLEDAPIARDVSLLRDHGLEAEVNPDDTGVMAFVTHPDGPWGGDIITSDEMRSGDFTGHNTTESNLGPLRDAARRVEQYYHHGVADAPAAPTGGLAEEAAQLTQAMHPELRRNSTQWMGHFNDSVSHLMGQRSLPTPDVHDFSPLAELQIMREHPNVNPETGRFDELMRDRAEELHGHAVQLHEDSFGSAFGDGAAAPNPPAKFSTYVLPGGENYREKLLTLPTKADTTILPDGFTIRNRAPGDDALVPKHMRGAEWIVEGPGPAASNRYASGATEAAAIAKFHELHPPAGQFKSSHWDEPNVLVHTRMNDRAIPNAEGGVDKSLHLEEIQSDWHQKGRREGYAGADKTTRTVPEIDRDLDANIAELTRREGPGRPDTEAEGFRAWGNNPDLQTQHDALMRERNAAAGIMTGVPDAPFKGTEQWAGLAFKRALREAAEGGYDRLSWTPGEAQAARYDLSKQLQELRVERTKNEAGITHYTVNASPKGGGQVSLGIKTEAELPDVIGKDMAAKIIGNPENHQVHSGLDLKVGGEGMKGFYDQMLPSIANKLGKKYGAKVEQTNLAGLKGLPNSPYHVVDENGHSIINFETAEKAQKYIDLATNPAKRGWSVLPGDAPQPPGQRVHSIKITPELRAAAMKGFPLFSAGAAVAAPTVFGSMAPGSDRGE